MYKVSNQIGTAISTQPLSGTRAPQPFKKTKTPKKNSTRDRKCAYGGGDDYRMFLLRHSSHHDCGGNDDDDARTRPATYTCGLARHRE